MRWKPALCALSTLLLGAAPPATIPAAWDFATATDVIGINPAYLEKRLGPAKYKDDGYWTFQVGACEINYQIERGRVTGYEFPLRPRCASHARGYGDLRGMVLRPGVTFGEIERLKLWQSEFSASCLEGCGNAADTWVYMDALGSRCGGPYPIHFGVDIERSPAAEAARKWEQALKAKYHITGYYIPAEAAQCGSRLSEVAAKAFEKIRVESVGVGDLRTAMTAPDCSQLEKELREARASRE